MKTNPLQKSEQLLSHFPSVALGLSKAFPLKRLLGKKYAGYAKRFDETDPWPYLKKITDFARKEVPFYRRQNYGEINSIEDFENTWGFIDKSHLRNRRDQFLSSRFRPHLYEMITTSGSTGEPSVFYLPRNRFYKEWAYVHKAWSRRGFDLQLRGVLRNHRLPENLTAWVRIPRKEIIFDAYRNKEDYYNKIYGFLKKHNIAFFQSYPHLAHNFFKFIDKNHLSYNFIRGVFLSSERFTPEQRRLLVDRMNLPVVSIYGLSEQLVFAVDFDGSGRYHVIESYGYLELVDATGKVIKEPGIQGEIIATGFDNFGMPLIRFRTGDISEYESVYPQRVLKGILGRTGQYVYNKDGSGVSVTSLNMHGDLLDYIEGIQYVQNQPGEVEIRIVPKDNLPEHIEQRMMNYFKERFKDDMIIHLKKVQYLEISKSGKLLPLISNVKQPGN